MLVNVMLFLYICGSLVGLILMVLSFFTNTVETVPRTRDELSEEIKKLTKEVAIKSFVTGFTNPLGIGVETSLGTDYKLMSNKDLTQQYVETQNDLYAGIKTFNRGDMTRGLKPGDLYSNNAGTFTFHTPKETLLYNPKTDELVMFVEKPDLFHSVMAYPDGEYLTWKTLEVLLDEGYQLVGEL